METVTYDLRGVLPDSFADVEFLRLELPKSKPIPLGLVWFTTPDSQEERGARIDLQKQVFLDDFGLASRESLCNQARMIVEFSRVHRLARKILTPTMMSVY
ncbi:MAG: hypothetical protein M3Y72_01980 [Acidobacteriota bacterium]|nr:hypothetical protein [Acidobacteriota bacterium]MDQ2839812.1 hypothetical protein [Acidobacteriota bacterium]